MAKDNDNFLSNPKLKKIGVKIEYTEEQFREYVKCVQDPIYFINNYIKIIALDEGLISFKMWDFQEDFVNTFHNNRFTIAKYGRRSGKTATVSAYIIWCILFNKNFNAAVLSYNLKASKAIMATIQLAYEELPKWLQQGVVVWNKTDIELENGSKVFANSTSSSAARGTGINLLYLDEFAFVPNNIQEEFFISAYPTITSGKTTKIIITSTPNGMDYFYKIWIDSENGRNSFKRLTVRWDEIPGRDQAWYEEQITSMGTLKFSQEFGVEFLGSSLTLISPSKIAALTYIDPIYSTKDGFNFYKEVNREHTYVMVVDTGHGVGLDYSAFIVVDTSTTPFEIVCTFRNNSMTPIIYPKYIMEAAVYFGNAYVLVETNDLGQQVVDILQEEMEYEGLIATANRTRSQEVSPGFATSTKYGVRTTKLVKRLGCATAKSIIESDQIKINDFNLLKEMAKFSYKHGSYEAEQGNDDLMMCLVLFSWITTQSYFKDITNTNINRRVYQEAGIDDYDIVPFGIISRNDTEEYTKIDNDLWQIMN